MDDSAGSEKRSGPKAWLVLALSAALVAVGIGVAIGARTLMRDDHPVASAPATTAPEGIHVVPVAADQIPNRLFTRVTAGGIELRVDRLKQPDGFWAGPPVGDDTPAYCTMTADTVSVAAVSPTSVGQSGAQLTEVAPPNGWVTMSYPGVVPGVSPSVLLVSVVQVPPTVTVGRLSTTGGVSDSMEPVDGIIALALELPMPVDADGELATQDFNRFPMLGFDLTGISVELLHDDATTTRRSGEVLFGSGVWNDPKCIDQFNGIEEPAETVPTTIPAPPPFPTLNGGEPADAAGAQAEIRAALTRLYEGFEDDAVLFAEVDDPSGLDLLNDQLFETWVNGEFEKMSIVVDEVRFISPIEATFTYRPILQLQSQKDWWWEFGRARLIDGTWKITRSTICADIEKSGTRCTV